VTPVAPLVDPCLAIVRISIDKSQRQLVATCENGAIKTFRVALGQLPLGYKREMHDLRTPEGFYRIAEAPRGSRFHVFMLLDYPSLADADRALSNGDISPRQYLRIARAVARGALPPQDTLLGGMIGIHGEGSDHQGDSSRKDWTFGCIALSDADAEYIAFRVDVGTPVTIEP
jgi:murein L,D-transpeptidase YafK